MVVVVHAQIKRRALFTLPTGSKASPEKAGECLDAAAQALLVIGHELPSVRTRSGEKRLPGDSSRRSPRSHGHPSEL